MKKKYLCCFFSGSMWIKCKYCEKCIQMDLTVVSEEKAFKSNSKWTFKFIRRLCPVSAVLASPDFKFPPADLVDFHSPTNLKMVL